MLKNNFGLGHVFSVSKLLISSQNKVGFGMVDGKELLKWNAMHVFIPQK